jgi:hypothetical protein
MPEYAALLHHRNRTSKPEGDAQEWTPDDLSAAFIRAERSGALRIN